MVNEEENSNHTQDIASSEPQDAQNAPEATPEDNIPDAQPISIGDLPDESIDNMSEDELNNLIDNADNLVAVEGELDPETNTIISETKPDVTKTPDKPETTNTSTVKTEVNESDKKTEEFTPPFDQEVFNNMPDEFKKVFQPIKANGVMNTYSPDELIKLVQLGTNYYANQEKIKPQLKVVKMIEKAGIRDNDQLVQLLDIVNGDKEALARFVKDKEIDLMDIDNLVEQGDELAYKPDSTKYETSEADMELERVDAQLKETSPIYDDVINTISTIDEESKNKFLDNPKMILDLEEHMRSGFYETVTSEIAKARVLGQYIGTNFIDAYEHMGKRVIESINDTRKQQELVDKQTTPEVNVPNSIAPKVEGQAPSKTNVIDLNDPNFIDSLTPAELDKLLR